MIRLQPLPLETDVLPQAIFWRPILYFSPKIREDEDGLDRFRVITFTIDNRVDRGTPPLLHDRERSLILRLVSGGEETFGDPGATQLILFTELTPGSGTDYSHPRVVLHQVVDLGFVVAEAELVAALQLVVAQTGVSKRAVAWQRGWDFEYGSLQRQTLDRLREPEARVLALKIAALCPNHAASTEQIKQGVPHYYPLSEIDIRRSTSRRREALWQQIVGNVVSHHKTASGLFGMGYAVRTRNGIRVTERGLGYLNRIGFSV